MKDIDKIFYYEYEKEEVCEYTDPDKSGLHSGKGNGFFRKLLLGE